MYKVQKTGHRLTKISNSCDAHPVLTSLTVQLCNSLYTTLPAYSPLRPLLQGTYGIHSLALVSATGAQAVFTGSSSLSPSNIEKWITPGKGIFPVLWKFANILVHMGEMVNRDPG